MLWRIWKVAEQPCGKRLAGLLPEWIQQQYVVLSRELREDSLDVSAAQIGRLLAPRKEQAEHHGRCGTKPGGLLKTQIPIRTDNWDITRPGFLEVDTVAHCGFSLDGDFIWSVTYTDIYSGWAANRAVWNKGAHGIVEATREVEKALPFELLDFDTDNGSEFLNWHLLRHFQDRPKAVGFTRSRPYKKDDNGHVEQNYAEIRIMRSTAAELVMNGLDCSIDGWLRKGCVCAISLWVFAKHHDSKTIPSPLRST